MWNNFGELGIGHSSDPQRGQSSAPTGYQPPEHRRHFDEATGQYVTARDYRRLKTVPMSAEKPRPGLWDRLLDMDNDLLDDLENDQKIRDLKDQYKKWPELQPTASVAVLEARITRLADGSPDEDYDPTSNNLAIPKPMDFVKGFLPPTYTPSRTSPPDPPPPRRHWKLGSPGWHMGNVKPPPRQKT